MQTFGWNLSSHESDTLSFQPERLWRALHQRVEVRLKILISQDWFFIKAILNSTLPVCFVLHIKELWIASGEWYQTCFSVCFSFFHVPAGRKLKAATFVCLFRDQMGHGSNKLRHIMLQFFPNWVSLLFRLEKFNFELPLWSM